MWPLHVRKQWTPGCPFCEWPRYEATVGTMHDHIPLRYLLGCCIYIGWCFHSLAGEPPLCRSWRREGGGWLKSSHHAVLFASGLGMKLPLEQCMTTFRNVVHIKADVFILSGLGGKRALMSVGLLSKHPKLGLDHLHYCPTGTVAGYVGIFCMLVAHQQLRGRHKTMQQAVHTPCFLVCIVSFPIIKPAGKVEPI